MTTDEFLAHHGVRGMRWGHRKEPERSPREKKLKKTYNELARGIEITNNKLKEKNAKKSSKRLERAIARNDKDIKALRQEANKVGKSGSLSSKDTRDKGKKFLLDLGIGVAAAAVGFGAYKGATKLRDLTANAYLKKANQVRKTIISDYADKAAGYYTKQAWNMNRRKAVGNFIKHYGKIKIDTFHS